jgi:hypothetical protein
MPSIDEVAGQVATAGVPVLFLDTCILLDIIRSPNRCLRNYAMQAWELLRLASLTPPACLIVVSSYVPGEWNTNVEEVTEEVAKHFGKMKEHASHFHDACEVLGIAVGFGRADYAQPKLHERLRDLSKQLLDAAICLNRDAESRERAFHRVESKTAPSRKGGGLVDCAIIEECLTVCRGSRVAGFTRKCVFCTSNTADYCEVGGRLHPALDLEFIACGLTFAKNLSGAVNQVTH